MIIDVRFDVSSIQELREILATGKDHSLLDYKVLKFENVKSKNRNSEFFGGDDGNTNTGTRNNA